MIKIPTGFHCEANTADAAIDNAEKNLEGIRIANVPWSTCNLVLNSNAGSKHSLR